MDSGSQNHQEIDMGRTGVATQIEEFSNLSGQREPGRPPVHLMGENPMACI